MKILLTGAAGYIGSTVHQFLVEAGHDVLATDIRRRRDPGLPLQVADLLDRTGCYRLVEGVDAVVHFGNHPRITTPDLQRLIVENTAMNTNVFQAAHECGVNKLVYASSIQVVSGLTDHYYDEGPVLFPYLPADHLSPAQPRNAYALSKHLGEKMLEYYGALGLQCVALRLPVVYRLGNPRHKRTSYRFNNSDIKELFAYITPDDAASLIERTVCADLPGYRARLVARADNYCRRPAAELYRESYSAIPLRKPVEELDRFVDCTILRDEIGWEPGRPAEEPKPEPLAVTL